MKIFECKCGSTDVFIEVHGNNTGLYCADCGKWITWLNKDQLRLAERQIEAVKDDERMKIRAEAIDEFTQELINPSNYERYDFDDCLTDSGKANDFFKYVFAMAEHLKEQKNENP